jgi:hypothetical protein
LGTTVLDSGAEENFISLNAAKRASLNTKKFAKSKTRYTCINTPFLIEYFVITKFNYKGKEEQDIFDILTNRKDDFIILGRLFMPKLSKEKEVNLINTEQEAGIVELSEKLFSYHTTEEIDYKRFIPTKQGDVVTGGTYFIPHAKEFLINEEISRLLKLGYIRPSTSTWLNKMKPVVKPNGSHRITLNLMKLN